MLLKAKSHRIIFLGRNNISGIPIYWFDSVFLSIAYNLPAALAGGDTC